MTKSTRKHKKTKAVNPCQEHFGVNENLLKFFPKASPMGFSKPTKWVYAENHNLDRYPAPVGNRLSIN